MMDTGSEGLKEHVVFWVSAYNGRDPGFGTPMFKPNMMTFDDSRDATKFVEKLATICNAGGLYRGRTVVRVSPCF